MSSPEKKRKKTTTEKPLLNPSPVLPNLPLPDDLLLSCIARVSRLDCPSLSLVSKSCRALLASPELYQTRLLLDRTESCLYVCLRLPSDPNPRWFTLCRKPNRTLKKKKKKQKSGNLLVPITSPHSTPVRPSFVVVGTDIYEIGGLINNVPSSNVSILDCRSNTWHKAPNMQVAREQPFATTIDEKILVKGGLEVKDSNAAEWVEVYDPKTLTWKAVSFTCGPKEWLSQDDKTGMAGYCSSRCVIDDVLYDFSLNKVLSWFDDKVKEWRIVKDLENKFRNMSCGVRLMADYGGKLAVLWDTHACFSKCQERMISCTVIALERCNSEEISGTVEWSDSLLKVPNSFRFLHALAATV